jgi:hypothetical protein
MVKDMPGYSRAVDVVDATQPYAMYPGTAYEHLMVFTRRNAAASCIASSTSPSN